MSDRAFRLILILESFARTEAFCFPSTQTLAEMMGRHPRKAQEVLAEVEVAGWIKRISGPRGKRLGIILLRRADPSLPAADTPERLAEIEAVVRARMPGKLSMPKTAPSSMPKTAPELGLTPELGHSCPSSSKAAAVCPTEITLSRDDTSGGKRDVVEEVRQLIDGLADPETTRRAHRPNVDRLARLTLRLVVDRTASLKFHRKNGWRVVDGVLTADQLWEAFTDTYFNITRRRIDDPARYYAGTIRKMLRGETDREMDVAFAEEAEDRGFVAVAG